MKNLRYVCAAAVAASVLTAGCTVVTPDPGTEVVVLDKPFLFGDGGVRSETYKPGRYFTWLSSSLFTVEMTPQRIDEVFDDLMTSDTIPVDFHTAVQLQVTDPVALVTKFGGNLKLMYANVLQRQYQALVRDEARAYTMNTLLTASDTTAKMEAHIRSQLDMLVAEHKLPVKITDISIGKATPNKNVLEQIDQTAAQQQRSKTMNEAKNAEVARKQAEIARAEADNAYREKMGLNPDQFLQLESIKRYSDACKSSQCILGFGSSSPVVQVQRSKQ